MEIFNKEDVYDNEISPLMEMIIDVCIEHEIPMVAIFTYENHPSKGAGRCTTFLNKFKERGDPIISGAAAVATVKSSASMAIGQHYSRTY